MVREERAEPNPRLGASDDVSGGGDGSGAYARPPSVAPPSAVLLPCPADVQTEGQLKRLSAPRPTMRRPDQRSRRMTGTTRTTRTVRLPRAIELRKLLAHDLLIQDDTYGTRTAMNDTEQPEA